jgi:hypothetical protein
VIYNNFNVYAYAQAFPSWMLPVVPLDGLDSFGAGCVAEASHGR